MNTVRVLNEIKTFLDTTVINKIELQKDSPDNVLAYELVNPIAVIGWLPPSSYLPEGIESTIPCIVVGTDEGTDSKDNTSYDIKLSFAVFSPGEHTPCEDNSVIYTPSFQGYLDLLNFIDLTKASLIRATIINNKFKISDEISWGMYEEQPYPYWYGWMKFSVDVKSYPRSDIEKLLN